MATESTEDDSRSDLRRRRAGQITRRRVNRYRGSEWIRREPGRDIRVGSVNGVHRGCHSTKQNVSVKLTRLKAVFSSEAANFRAGRRKEAGAEFTKRKINGCRQLAIRLEGLSTAPGYRARNRRPSASRPRLKSR
jgi:hypothetical protein